MTVISTQTLLLKGHFPNDAFPAWIIRRATLLELHGWVKTHNHSLIEIFASGHPVLLDAMEVACSLGPFDVNVNSIEKKQEITPENHYRQNAQFIRYCA